jgi:hypothetical protein
MFLGSYILEVILALLYPAKEYFYRNFLFLKLPLLAYIGFSFLLPAHYAYLKEFSKISDLAVQAMKSQLKSFLHADIEKHCQPHELKAVIFGKPDLVFGNAPKLRKDFLEIDLLLF